MVTDGTIGDAVLRWATQNRKVAALVLIGSRARASANPLLRPDVWSDWDFQLITNEPRVLLGEAWLSSAGLPQPSAYVFRLGRLGAAPKVTAVFPQGMLDVVVLSAGLFTVLRWAARARLLHLLPRQSALQGLSATANDGFQVLKGGEKWRKFYHRVASEIQPLRLSDPELVALASGFVCDYVATRNKIERGEFIAAQRWLHVELAEVQLRLLHELRRRRSEPSMPDGRRIERLADPVTVAAMRIDARPERDELLRATDHAAAALRDLMRKLVGDAWRWPDI